MNAQKTNIFPDLISCLPNEWRQQFLNFFPTTKMVPFSVIFFATWLFLWFGPLLYGFSWTNMYCFMGVSLNMLIWMHWIKHVCIVLKMGKIV